MKSEFMDCQNMILMNKKRKATILLGYANMSEEAIRDASNILCEIWK